MISSFSSVFGPKFSVLVIALAALSSITVFCSLPQLQIVPLTQQSQEENDCLSFDKRWRLITCDQGVELADGFARTV